MGRPLWNTHATGSIVLACKRTTDITWDPINHDCSAVTQGRNKEPVVVAGVREVGCPQSRSLRGLQLCVLCCVAELVVHVLVMVRQDTVPKTPDGKGHAGIAKYWGSRGWMGEAS